MITVGDAFAGLGGFSLVFEHFGCKTAWFIENEPFCQKVLRKHFDAPIYGDIYECHDLPYVDILTAGFPCQPFSVAGARKGEKDERYLLPELLRVIEEVQPRVVLFENVPGFPSLTDGNTFKLLLKTLAEMGYDALWGHLRASDAGAPHLRERWFCIAWLDDTKKQRCNNGSNSAHIGTSYRTQHPSAMPSTRHRTHVAYASRQLGIRRQPANQTQRQGAYASEWQRVRSEFASDGALADTTSVRQQRFTAQPGSLSTGKGKGWQHQLTRTCAGSTQSFMGRDVDGLSYGLDRHQFPARPNEAQHASEPPRVTTQTEGRAARLKALGNSIVPQSWLPIAEMIVEWLRANTPADVRLIN